MIKLLGALLTFLLLVSSTPAQTNVNYQRTEDIVYGRKYGMALTLDVFQPPQPNGAGIVSVVSGGWFSAHEAINPPFYRELLNRH